MLIICRMQFFWTFETKNIEPPEKLHLSFYTFQQRSISNPGPKYSCVSMRNVLQVDISGYLKENSKIHKLQSSDMWITSVKLSYLE